MFTKNEKEETLKSYNTDFLNTSLDEIYEDIMDHYFGDRSSAAVNTYTILSKL